MDLFTSLITNNTPTFTSFCKYWLIKILEVVIDILLMYPINVLIFTCVLFIMIYKVCFKFTGNKQFKQTYKPLKHRENLTEDIKLMKKQMRQMQGEIIQMRKKISHQNNYQENKEQIQTNKNEYQPDQNLQCNQIDSMHKLFQSKIKQSKETNRFNQQLQKELKLSMAQMLGVLKKLNTT